MRWRRVFWVLFILFSVLSFFLVLKIGTGDLSIASLMRIEHLTWSRYLLLSWVVGLSCWACWYLRVQLDRVVLILSDSFLEEKARMERLQGKSSGVMWVSGILFNGPYLYPAESLAMWAIVAVLTFVVGRVFIL
jgi:hypothetical protein